MKREDVPYIVCGLFLFVVAFLLTFRTYLDLAPVREPPKGNGTEAVAVELDRASARMKTLIETQQSKVAGHVFLADAELFDATELKTDISVKVKYLLWQIEVSIALQRIETGKSPGKVPGMSITQPAGKPVGSANK